MTSLGTESVEKWRMNLFDDDAEEFLFAGAEDRTASVHCAV